MNAIDLALPKEERRFEDYVPGMVCEYGSIAVSEADIVDFARRFDPQPIHTDRAAAERGDYGGLIASGWHTATVMMRLLVGHFLSSLASLGSPGIDELRWRHPVRPGDVLRIRVAVVEARRSRSKPDRGLVRTLVEVLNQNDEVVMSLKAMNLMRCRSAPTLPSPASGRGLGRGL